jgi:hypothetical protein
MHAVALTPHLDAYGVNDPPPTPCTVHAVSLTPDTQVHAVTPHAQYNFQTRENHMQNGDANKKIKNACGFIGTACMCACVFIATACTVHAASF